jgi:hypothetical protein
MAHIHEEPVVEHRSTTVIEDRGGGFGAGLIVGIVAIVAAVIIGLALLITQPWDDNGSSTPGVPDTSDSAPNLPGDNGGGDNGGGGGGGDNNGGGGGGGGGEQPAQ